MLGTEQAPRVDGPLKDPKRRKVMVVGEGYWSKDDTEDAALKGLKSLGWRGDRYLVYDVSHRTQVDSMGGFTYYSEDGPEPVLVARVRRGKNRRWQREAA